MPKPQLPDEECFDCPEGNRFMKHIDTRQERLPQIGPEEEFDFIATFRCSRCGHVKREAFDPKAPGQP